MSRYQRRAIGWVIGAFLVLAVWWLQAGNSASAPRMQPIEVLQVVRPLAAGDVVRATDVGLRRVASSAGLSHSLSDASQAVGKIAAVPLTPGETLMDAELGVPEPAGGMVDVALKLDPDSGVPAGDTSGIRGDLVLTEPGRVPRTIEVMRNVQVVAVARTATTAVVTLRLPRKLVVPAVQAESEGDLRLVAHVSQVAQ